MRSLKVLATLILLTVCPLLRAEPGAGEITYPSSENNASFKFGNGPEYPGAAGAAETDTVEGIDVLLLNYDFAGGGAYVEALTAIDVGEGLETIKVRARAENAVTLFIRLVDEADHTMQRLLKYETPGEWQTFELTITDNTWSRWGDSSDPKIRYPLRKISLGVEKPTDGADSGRVIFSPITFSK